VHTKGYPGQARLGSAAADWGSAGVRAGRRVCVEHLAPRLPHAPAPGISLHILV